MPPPDLILHGGKSITLDRSSRVAQAISVRSGHVAAVGDDAAVLKDAAPTTQLIDLEVGKVADMAVLAEDPLTCDLDRPKDIRIERTFLGGRQVFGPT